MVANKAAVTQVLLVLVSVLIAVGFFAAVLIFALRSSESRPGKAIPVAAWLLVPLVIGGLSELYRASREGWDIGDTIGAIVFCIILTAGVITYRKRRVGAK